MAQGFQKGNVEAKKKTGHKQGAAIEEYLTYLAGGAAREYYQNVEKLFSGAKLSPEVKEAMDRFERNTEFIIPKLARTILSNDESGEFHITLD